MSREPPVVSVILCTRDRAHRLTPCLEHIAESGRKTGASWELVVVDNGSSDGTSDLVGTWSSGQSFDVRLVAEPRVGLSAARNRGVAAARGALLAFTDDDCLVDPGWLKAVVSAFEATVSPDLVGGRVGLWDGADARMSVREFDDALEIHDFGSLCERLIGCNFVVRAAALQAIGQFDEQLGAGSAAGSAEDFDLFYRMLSAGFRLRYEPAAQLLHDHGRRLAVDVERTQRLYVRGRGALYAKHVMRGDRTIGRYLYWDLMRRSSLRSKLDLAAGAFGYLWARSTGRART